MAPQKTKAIILKVNPFRETSSILYLFSEQHGLVRGVAKGVKRKKDGQPGLERGFLAEMFLYVRPHRDLHTVAGISILDYYPGLRTDLHKSAVRDTAFEVVMATMSSDSPHPEIFFYLTNFIRTLDALSATRCFPAMAWRFFYDFSALMGFGPNINVCAQCDRRFSDTQGAYLFLESGTLLCSVCATRRARSGAFLPLAVLMLLADTASQKHFGEIAQLSGQEVRRISHQLARYCQYHFQHYSNFKSLEFLDSLCTVPATGCSRSKTVKAACAP
jgi:DNA repair protein RecO (recombination protein O)